MSSAGDLRWRTSTPTPKSSGGSGETIPSPGRSNGGATSHFVGGDETTQCRDGPWTRRDCGAGRRQDCHPQKDRGTPKAIEPRGATVRKESSTEISRGRPARRARRDTGGGGHVWRAVRRRSPAVRSDPLPAVAGPFDGRRRPDDARGPASARLHRCGRIGQTGSRTLRRQDGPGPRGTRTGAITQGRLSLSGRRASVSRSGPNGRPGRRRSSARRWPWRRRRR